MAKRTHSCGALRPDDVGRQVTLMGWVRARRDHGRLVFLDLWDREGVTQIVIDARVTPEAAAVAHSVRDEYVVAIQGVVRARPGGTENAALATGQVEVAAAQIEVLNPASPLPFPPDDAAAVDEALRQRYRYLDLRRQPLLDNLRLRHRVVKSIRDALDAEGFLEVETPVLTRSTPEGARDYLVPSRVHPGEFYALPQSPQQMKQLLMVGGVDRYYQIARCFRDEDLRADRQPEFTQLDLEMSFVTQEDILRLVEALVVRVIREVRPDLRFEVPFPRLTYREALTRYGSDKPDLRWDMAFVDCTALLGSSGAQIFRDAVAAGGVIKGIRVPGHGDASHSDLDALDALSQALGAGGVVWMRANEATVVAPVSQHLAPEVQQALLRAFGAEPGDLLLIVAGDPDTVSGALDGVRREVGRRLDPADPDRLACAWVVDFPLLHWNSDAGRWDAEHHPFTSPRPEDIPLLASEPGSVRASCYDLVCNGWEVGSGSIRIHRRELQTQVLGVLGYTEEEAQASFGHLLEAFEYGAPPHGGIALGVDRLAAILAGTDTIRDVIAFPKTRQAVDATMQAPAPVTKAQLDEIHIRVAPLRGHASRAGTEGGAHDRGPSH